MHVEPVINASAVSSNSLPMKSYKKKQGIGEDSNPGQYNEKTLTCKSAKYKTKQQHRFSTLSKPRAKNGQSTVHRKERQYKATQPNPNETAISLFEMVESRALKETPTLFFDIVETSS